ncbi:MAG: hypothetical protein OXG37_03600 [Actinomycetia bacterium]|nr:hypothetical protein [Actinomycetes bacterium]
MSSGSKASLAATNGGGGQRFPSGRHRRLRYLVGRQFRVSAPDRLSVAESFYAALETGLPVGTHP